MSSIPDTKEIKKAGPTDHLANERTFLAWIRTSIALIGFGFVIVKFALFVQQMSLVMGGKAIPAGKGHSGTVGIVMVIFGAVIAFLSYLRYRNIEKQLNNSQYFPSPLLSALVAMSIVIASILLVIYLLPGV
jgi:putative membrane protein